MSADCTGISASWCPVHGDCKCPRHDDGSLAGEMNDVGCPLHAPTSNHAEGVDFETREELEQRVLEMSAEERLALLAELRARPTSRKDDRK